ncbi:FAD-binding oxidoreductase [Corynebacterium hylobatis]|nr:FAD-binding oxidoreductase [Corynebacterium hylobatis]
MVTAGSSAASKRSYTAEDFGLTPERLDAAVVKFRKVLGEEGVLTGDAAREFGDPFSPDEWVELIPPVVLQPTNTEQVQDIVRIANEYEVPLWTTSQGRNLGYGGSAPRLPGSVVVNLRRMNKVVEVNDELGYVVVEPGVSYNQLYEELRARRSRLWADVPDIGWGSVVGNAMDHGIGYSVYGDHAGAVCGMEVVLADGEIMRTGMGAMENNRTWHLSPRGYGPTADGIFMQSNYGIVTRMGYHCFPEPEIYMPCFAMLDSDDLVEPFLEALRPLMLNRTIMNIPSMFNALGALSFSGGHDRNEIYDGEGPVPQEAAEAYARDRLGVGAWSMRFALYGAESVVDEQFKIVKQTLEAVEGVRIVGQKHPGNDLPVEEFDQNMKVQACVPDMSMLKATDFIGAERGGHMTFSSLVPLTGRDGARIRDLVKQRVEGIGLDYTSTFLIHQRHAIHVAVIIFNLEDESAPQAYETCRQLIAELGELGYAEYRAHVDYMDLVASLFGYNNHIQLDFNERIKDALDPKGILSPGKQGIWPRRLRELGADDR